MPMIHHFDIAAMIDNPDIQSVAAHTLLDAEDMARVLTSFRGQPITRTPALGYIRSSSDGVTSAYVFDDESGMVYLLT
jgi:hypothetical protein